jgi:hypothetical protein
MPGEPSVNQIFLVRGRTPQPGRRDEAVVLQSFADAHELTIGDTVPATIYGGREEVAIVGIALSPEHVYAIAPGQLVPDDGCTACCGWAATRSPRWSTRTARSTRPSPVSPTARARWP